MFYGCLFCLSVIVLCLLGIQNFLWLFSISLFGFFISKYSKNKKVLIFSILVIVVLLLLFRVYLFIPSMHNILVPLGFSYYSLQLIAYLVDIYKGKIKRENSFLKYVFYMMYLPPLFIGPILRYNEVEKEMFQETHIKKENISLGVSRILWGLFKKFVIANRILLLLNVWKEQTGLFILASLFLYTLELYSDFSGGIDIVIGVSKIFGITIPENFLHPFNATTIKEFWNRWHIGLSRWLKDYVYIPLGGNKVGKIRQKINVIITFLVSGIWHGLSYLWWGLFHGLCVSFPISLKSKKLSQIITFSLVSLSWIFFLYPNTFFLPFQKLSSIITIWNGLDFFNSIFQVLNIWNWFILIISVFLMMKMDVKIENWSKNWQKKSLEKKTLWICTFLILILLFGVYGLGFQVTDFIYSKF